MYSEEFISKEELLKIINSPVNYEYSLKDVCETLESISCGLETRNDLEFFRILTDYYNEYGDEYMDKFFKDFEKIREELGDREVF